MTTLADDDDVRLLYYLKLAHGTGRAYHHTSDHRAARRRRVRAARAARPDAATSRSWAADVDAHAPRGEGQDPVAGRLVADGRHRPRDGADRRPRRTSPCSTWKTAHGRYEAKLDAYLEKARTHYAPSLEERTDRSLLTLLGVFQAALGAPRRREIVLWQRVDFPDRLPGLFTRELPPHVKGPGTWMHDALEVRDDWESRLLRSAEWSPLG